MSRARRSNGCGGGNDRREEERCCAPKRHGRTFGGVGIRQCSGYPSGMKTAISVPDRVFRKAEQYARRAKKSRSQVYSEAVAEYLARHVPDAITETMNDVCAQLGDQRDDFVVAASRRVLRREKW